MENKTRKIFHISSKVDWIDIHIHMVYTALIKLMAVIVMVRSKNLWLIPFEVLWLIDGIYILKEARDFRKDIEWLSSQVGMPGYIGAKRLFKNWDLCYIIPEEEVENAKQDYDREFNSSKNGSGVSARSETSGGDGCVSELGDNDGERREDDDSYSVETTGSSAGCDTGEQPVPLVQAGSGEC